MRSIWRIIRKMSYITFSPAEEGMVLYLCDLPEWVDFDTNYKVGPYLVDIAMPQYKVGLEIDGWQYHTSEGQVAHDTKRDTYLQTVAKWKIVRLPAWFVYRYPDLSLLTMLRYIPSMKRTPLYKRLFGRLVQYNIREAANEGMCLVP